MFQISSHFGESLHVRKAETVESAREIAKAETRSGWDTVVVIDLDTRMSYSWTKVGGWETHYPPLMAV